MRQLGGAGFGCTHDADVESKKLQKEYPLHHLHGRVVEETRYASKGKPAEGAVTRRIEYALGFMVDSVFLKSPQRISALMVMVTLCLLVYNIAEYKLRLRLEETGETLPNRLNKPVQNPALRWIFQIMEGLGVVRIQENPEGPPRELLTILSPLRMKIIQKSD